LYAFDPTHAHALGINPRMLGAILLGLLALTSVVALQAVGVVLVVAMLIIPGATAYLLTDRLQRMLLIAPAISVLCASIGLYSSSCLDPAAGGVVVVARGAVFLLVYLFGPRHGRIGRGVAARERRRRVTADRTGGAGSGQSAGLSRGASARASRLGAGRQFRRGSVGRLGEHLPPGGGG